MGMLEKMLSAFKINPKHIFFFSLSPPVCRMENSFRDYFPETEINEQFWNDFLK